MNKVMIRCGNQARIFSHLSYYVNFAQ